MPGRPCIALLDMERYRMKHGPVLALAVIMLMMSSLVPSFVGGISGGTASGDVGSSPKEGGNSPLDDAYSIDGQPVMEPALPRPLEVGSFVRTLDDLSVLNDPMMGFKFVRNVRPMDVPLAGTKDENDGIDNATELNDGDSITNNVTSWISGNNLHTSDIDIYYVDLVVDGVNNSVQKFTATIGSQDGVNKHAHLITQCILPNPLFNQFDNADFEVTGGLHGASSVIEITPEGDPAVNVVMTYFLVFISYNNSAINYTLDLDITTTTRTEWNGFFGGGFQINATKKPARMQSVQRNNDLYDWYDISPLILESGMDQDRGDQILLSLRVDVATEERGYFYGYAGPGLWGQQVWKTTLIWLYMIYYNYSSQQLNVVLNGQNLPFAAILFGNDPVTIGGYLGQVDHAWLGVAPEQLWIWQNQGYLDSEGDARVQYNITDINFRLLPPNDPPAKRLDISDLEFDEDTGPWMKVIDLEKYFYDKESQGALRFDVMGTDPMNSAKLEVKVDEDNRHLNVLVNEPNWFGKNSYTIRCFDNGTDLKRNSDDDLFTDSNEFDVSVYPINDDAYIEKVDMAAGTKVNDHGPLVYTIMQGQALRSKKIYGFDNDTEDQDYLVYESNSTTDAFVLKSNGQFDFIPRNEDVGVTWVEVTIDDGHAPHRDDFCLLKFDVANINDKPELTLIEWKDGNRDFDLTVESEPTFKGVKEDMEINLTVTASDPDIEIGIPDALTWTIGSDEWKVTKHPYDPLKAYVTYTPTNDDAVASFVETKLSALDSKNAMTQEITIKLNIENTNDAPRIISVNGEKPVGGKVKLDSSNGLNGFEDQPFNLHIVADEMDPRDSITFKANDPSFGFTADRYNEMAANFTMLTNQDLVGPHMVIITVTDESLVTDTVRVEYEIVNTNDAPNQPGMTYEDYNLFTTWTINFTAKDNGDPDGDALTFLWDFGDNTKTEGTEVSHFYRKAGAFTVKLTAKDPSGATSVLERTLSIYDYIEDVDPNKDTDGDGMIDTWEDEHGTDKNTPDADKDPDRDGFTNLEEYQAKTNPIDPRSHPVDTSGEGGGLDPLLIVILAAALIIIVAAVLFFLLIVMRKPKPVMQQQYYGREVPGMMPPMQSPQLPPQGAPQVSAGPSPPQLPPAPTQKEPDVLDEYMEAAVKDMKAEEAKESKEEKNVWRPPAESTDQASSQVDDLFDDSSKAPPPPPKLPNLPSMPPPPEI